MECTHEGAVVTCPRNKTHQNTPKKVPKNDLKPNPSVLRNQFKLPTKEAMHLGRSSATKMLDEAWGRLGIVHPARHWSDKLG